MSYPDHLNCEGMQWNQNQNLIPMIKRINRCHSMLSLFVVSTLFSKTLKPPRAFFENAGGSYVPRQVIDRLSHFFQFTKVQPYGPFPSSIAAGEAMDDGYRCIAELLNADEDELTLGPSTTLNFYVLAQAIRPTLKAGDEIIVTNQDHEANIGCWERLREFDVVIKKWRIDPETGELNLEDLKTLITDRTRLVCFSLCSNIVGTMNDVNAIANVAHDAGALAIGDGVSFAPHRLVDVNQLGIDLYLLVHYNTEDDVDRLLEGLTLIHGG